jgi:hypothetical protein
MNVAAKTLIVFGIIFIVVGILLVLSTKIGWIGRLPGYIHIEKKNFSFYFPVTTCIFLSIIITFILFLVGRR